MKFKHTYTMDLAPDEAEMRAEDFPEDSPLRILFELYGPGPVITLCRFRGGERLKIPTIEYITKPARARSRSVFYSKNPSRYPHTPKKL